MSAQAPTRTCTNLPEFLKAEELADLLRINRKTIYEAARRDEIPGAVRVGRLLRFRRDAVLAWMHAGDHR
jgi:excisionase family DNA binding protein